MPAHWTAGLPISIHTLRMEGDQISFNHFYAPFLFQSTPSAWRVTDAGDTAIGRKTISIHTLRMEGDLYARRNHHCTQHFNPHPPHGG